MNINQAVQVPTGHILIVEGEKGYLECLSIGDYGKHKNLKADFLGLTEDIHGVPHGDVLSLEDKWVITISTQYGCSMGCLFCDVPKVGPGVNATFEDMKNQVEAAMSIHPEIVKSRRLNLHFARMGEPTFNWDVIRYAERIESTERLKCGKFHVHPVVSTMMPKDNNMLSAYIQSWCRVKNNKFGGEAGLQLSINGTDKHERESMFGGSARSLEEIASIMDSVPDPEGRKYTLNFALAGYKIDAAYLAKLFPTERFLCKITPMHETNSALENSLVTEHGYTQFTPYRKIEEELKEQGFDVIVFVPSVEEDSSRITCGNALLALEKHEGE